MGGCASCLRSVLANDLETVDWQDWHRHPALRHYELGEPLGQGAFSKVFQAYRRPLPADGKAVALKIVFLGNPNLSARARDNLKAESDILCKLRHPHIVEVNRNDLWDRTGILLIEEELLEGCELDEGIKEASVAFDFVMTESWARLVMKQVLSALAYMHSAGILHRDIKPENMRFTRPTKEWAANSAAVYLKLLDFGLAASMTNRKALHGCLGTPGFVAPELADDETQHTPAMDLFAVGVILFKLLTGHKPMGTDAALGLEYAYIEAWQHTRMRGNPRWDAVSAAGQDLVLRLLERDPRRRISALEALRHPWMLGEQLAQDTPPAAPAVAAPDGVPPAAAAATATGAMGPEDLATLQRHVASSPDLPPRPALPRISVARIKESDELAAAIGDQALDEGHAWIELLAAIKRLERLLHVHASHLIVPNIGALGTHSVPVGTPEWHHLVRDAYRSYQRHVEHRDEPPNHQRPVSVPGSTASTRPPSPLDGAPPDTAGHGTASGGGNISAATAIAFTADGEGGRVVTVSLDQLWEMIEKKGKWALELGRLKGALTGKYYTGQAAAQE